LKIKRLNLRLQCGDRLPIPMIPPPDSEGSRHPVPIQVATQIRFKSPPLVGA